MKNPPSFQFYPQDFLSDFNVINMNDEECGIYIKLLCHCWIEDGLPTDDGDPIATLFKSRRIAKCFVKKNGKFRNPRLDKERKKQLLFHKSMQEAGLRGAEKRWLGHREAIAKGMASDGSSSSSSNKNKKPPTPFKKGGRKYFSKRVGLSPKKEHDDAYWAEVKRLKTLGKEGKDLIDALDEWKKKSEKE